MAVIGLDAGGTKILVGVVDDEDAVAVGLQLRFQQGSGGVLAMQGFAGNADDFHTVSPLNPISSKTTGVAARSWESRERATSLICG